MSAWPGRMAAERIRAVRLSRAWLIAAGLTVLLLGSYEAACRAGGLEPCMRDSPRLWAHYRGKASSLGRRALVLVGASRMQVDVDLGALAAATGMEPVQLAIDATGGKPILADLADDESFCGIVLSSLTPGQAAADNPRAHEYLSAYHDECLSDRIEFPLWAAVQRSLAFRRPGAGYLLVKAALRGEPEKLRAAPIRPDRSRPTDYTVFDPEPRRRRVQAALGSPPRRNWSPQEFQSDCAELEAMARRIRARGGQVIFVRMPTSEPLWTRQARAYPRADYWDRFAAASGSPTIHFADYPSLSCFECPDYSHLDASDAPAFSHALGRVVMEKLGR